MKESIRRATQLSKKAKDVRDELNILRTIASFQLAVQSRLANNAMKKEDLTAQYNLNDINELDKLASRIQGNVDTTLTLEESEIANFQAEVAVKQGRTLMVFTVVTILFVSIRLSSQDNI
ncbi:hypothetical protein SLS62_007197 [Diatrype stigma]|uniref:Uncharacterized protein n=1 Tax=Diatrype stigma TaxID=117547 RepID=A0AAN9YMC7_9PEZI